MTRLFALLGIVALAAVGGVAVTAGAPDGPDPALSDAKKALEEFHKNVAGAPPRGGTHVAPPPPFDVEEIARRALGRHWRDRSKAEVADFGELVVRRMRRWYTGLITREGTPTFGPGTTVGSWAILPATAPTRQRALVYRLRSSTKGGPWRVYDVETNGRSRIRAFYTEFDQVILNEGYRALVGRLRADTDGDTAGP